MAKHHIVKKEKRYDFWGHLTIPYQYLYGDGKMSAETFATLISNYLKQEYKVEMDIAEGIKLYSTIHHETPRDADGYKFQEFNNRVGFTHKPNEEVVIHVYNLVFTWTYVNLNLKQA